MRSRFMARPRANPCGRTCCLGAPCIEQRPDVANAERPISALLMPSAPPPLPSENVAHHESGHWTMARRFGHTVLGITSQASFAEFPAAACFIMGQWDREERATVLILL